MLKGKEAEEEGKDLHIMKNMSHKCNAIKENVHVEISH